MGDWGAGAVADAILKVWGIGLGGIAIVAATAILWRLMRAVEAQGWPWKRKGP